MRIIRKYPNRRLYDTETGKFINLGQLRELVERGEPLRVEDKTSGDDITRSMLLQVIVEAEEAGHPILSETLLRQFIHFHGDALQDYLTHYLESSMSLFASQADEVHSTFGNFMEQGPFAAFQDMGKQNLALWEKFLKSTRPSKGETDPD